MANQKVVVAEDPSSFSIDSSPYFQALIKVKRFAEILLHQQLWCFGQDIKIPENNLLIRYGLERIRPPYRTSGSTSYIVRIDGEISLILWGFGIYYGYGNNKGVYLGRYDFYPKLIGEKPLNLPVWSPSALPEFISPANKIEWEYSFWLMSELFDWIARYEEWVKRVMGGSYREDCLKDWKQSIVSGDDAAWAWRKIANFLRKHLVCHEVSSKTLFQVQKNFEN